MMVINTTTLEDYLIIVEWAIDQDMKWRDGGKSINESYWRSYGSKMCVVVRTSQKEISFCSLSYAFSNYRKKDIFNMDQFYGIYQKCSINRFRKKFGLR